MSFCFYPKHEFACPHVSHCPHLGGAALGSLVHLANESGDSLDRLHRQLDATRKSVSDLVAENEALQTRGRASEARTQARAAEQVRHQSPATGRCRPEPSPRQALPRAEPRKRGAPKGHPGWFRPTPTEYDVARRGGSPGGLSALRWAGQRLHVAGSNRSSSGGSVAGRRHVTLFRHPQARCRSCRRWVQTAGEGEILGSMIGPRLRAIAVYLHTTSASVSARCRAIATCSSFASLPRL